MDKYYCQRIQNLVTITQIYIQNVLTYKKRVRKRPHCQKIYIASIEMKIREHTYICFEKKLGNKIYFYGR